MNRFSLAMLTRRASLRTLSAAGLAAATRSRGVSAKKNGDKFKKCKKQVDDCTTRLLASCDGTPAQCTAEAACCDDLKHCHFDSFMFCLATAEG
jgi:hypothetical protein